MRDNDPSTEALHQFSHEADLRLWHKDRERFISNYEEFVKTVDIPSLGERELVELYALAQEQLANKINDRDNPITLTNSKKEREEVYNSAQGGMDKKGKNYGIVGRFEFLGKLGQELDKPERQARLRAKGINFPLTMEKRVFNNDISAGETIDVTPERPALE